MTDPSQPEAGLPATIGRLGPFAVARDGTLFPAATERAPGFGFRWRGRRIAARLLPGRVGFAVVAAHVPFTAENPALRTRVIAAVAGLRGLLPEGWGLRLTPDHAIHIQAEAPLDRPPTATRLVAAATGFLLALAPIVALLEEEGARPA